jgi:hypothetical protein
MKTIIHRIFFFGIFLPFSFYSEGQNTRLDLDPEFLSTAVEYKVNKKPSSCGIHKKKWNKPWNFYGPFVVANWNRQKAEHNSKRNFWGTKFEQMEFNEWAYEVVSPETDAQEVDVAYRFSSNEKYSIQPLEEVPLWFGEDELMSQKLNVLVSVNLRNSEENPWMLVLSFGEGSEERTGFFGRFFKGDTNIEVIPVASGAVNSGLISLNSQGFVFIRSGKQIAAVQNFTGDMWKFHDRYVWLDPSLEQELKTNVTAAISAILLLKDDLNFIQASGFQVYSED